MDSDRRTHDCFRWMLRLDALRPVVLESRLALLRTAAAARLHEVRSGRLPGRMEDLVPGILPEAPRDPFADGPLLLSPSQSGVVIEGVGPPPGIGDPPLAKMRRALPPR